MENADYSSSILTRTSTEYIEYYYRAHTAVLKIDTHSLTRRVLILNNFLLLPTTTTAVYVVEVTFSRFILIYDD